MLVRLIVVSLLLAETSAQLANSDRIHCFASARNAANAEPDKKLKKFISDTLDVVSDLALDVLSDLTDEQRDRIVNYYFGDTCGDLKSILQ